MTDHDLIEARERAFSVAAAMPAPFHQEAQALLDLALETGASFHATKTALQRLSARYSVSPQESASAGSQPLR